MSGYTDIALGLRLLLLGAIAIWVLYVVVEAICILLPLCADPTCPEHHS